MNGLLTAEEYLPGVNPDPISVSVSRAFRRLLGQPKSLPTLFNELTNRLTKFFSISRSTLIVREPATGRLRLISIWDDKMLREGLGIDLPEHRSLLYQMAETELRSYEADPILFQGNRIEKRLMYNSHCRSLVICSAKPENGLEQTEGYLTLASPVPDAFELITSGHFDSIFSALGETMAQKRVDRGQGARCEKRWGI